LGQHHRDLTSLANEVRVARNVDDVVKVARPTPLGQRSELLTEQFDERVANRAVAGQGRIAVLVPNKATLRLVDQDLIGRDI
jgi:hypothetical protein